MNEIPKLPKDPCLLAPKRSKTAGLIRRTVLVAASLAAAAGLSQATPGPTALARSSAFVSNAETPARIDVAPLVLKASPSALTLAQHASHSSHRSHSSHSSHSSHHSGSF